MHRSTGQPGRAAGRIARALAAAAGCVYCSTAIGVGGARADVIPPEPHAETCLIEKQCPSGQECIVCTVDFDSSLCERNLAPHGWKQQCATESIPNQKQIWCRSGSGGKHTTVVITPPDAGPDASASDANLKQTLHPVQCGGGGGCNVAPQRQAPRTFVPWLAVLAGLATLAVSRRRRRSRE